MSHFHKVVEVLVQKLEDKGYTHLDRPADRPDTPLYDLIQEAMDPVIKDRLWKQKPLAFTVTLYGLVGESRDNVRFDFEFEYDPVFLKCPLKALTASQGEQTHRWVVDGDSPKDLPTPQAAHAKLVGDTLKKEQRPPREIPAVKGPVLQWTRSPSPDRSSPTGARKRIPKR